MPIRKWGSGRQFEYFGPLPRKERKRRIARLKKDRKCKEELGSHGTLD